MVYPVFTTIGVIQQQAGAAAEPTGIVDAYGMNRLSLLRTDVRTIKGYGMNRLTLVRTDVRTIKAYGMTRLTLVRSP